MARPQNSKYKKLKHFFITKISILIADNKVDYPIDYQKEMLDFTELKDVLEYGFEVWKSICWIIGKSSPIPPLVETREEVAEYSNILIEFLLEKEQKLKDSNNIIATQENSIKTLSENLTDLQNKEKELEQKLKEWENHRCNIPNNDELDRLKDELKEIKQVKEALEKEVELLKEQLNNQPTNSSTSNSNNINWYVLGGVLLVGCPLIFLFLSKKKKKKQR